MFILTCVESGVLLDVRQLLESPITIRTFVRLLTRVNSEMQREEFFSNFLANFKQLLATHLMCCTNWWLLEKDLRHC